MFSRMILVVVNSSGSLLNSWDWRGGGPAELHRDNDDQSVCDGAWGRSNNAPNTEVVIFRFWAGQRLS